ncbi:conserved Plasmodium protein, unknown function [Plasmodium knowlesi strain H]|uniref:Uncharacterized protein n=3 Tax=Plasmodium knowlesi TaxID=5850 RepID=A0A5K1TWM5_PLAKH|nr:uncharacterized protein PKNH_1403100 [Plasmodium knowlesi strain H]OTN64224.1 Uncharacterized protein PKNOH_S140220200 [Plasmodium knowlesi]CAA9990630.1 conserved protein, unknown function [Plasmodium knowlesi strain H]SBO26024.1 conserved Plasmodium protein, unknown function [Plasmodium knowlesi strain H]SBO28728.1 conserved Plasmodium protein, unknown function [Plasmodium knowlesi strain H]VVS80104.1 conserved protein, unknown function [Plasmodium knowlesi strain H]|eukprot:XP_002261921.1 [Plasmodium knowlesi strain H]
MNAYLLEKRLAAKWFHARGNPFVYRKSRHVKHFSQAQIPKRVGFMKPAFKLNRKAQKYIVNVQWLKSGNTKELQKLCNDIKKDANSFNSYEIIDLVYYLSKHSNRNVYLTIEPLLFHFFRKYNASVNLNGVSIHRLLRVLTEYQDLVYREWIYSIAKIISKKHAHISMRDIQLILDDLALFYDFQIHCQITPFYNTVINRIHELEIKRLPFLIHVIGRIGCNNPNLLNILVATLKKNISKNDLYRSDFSGLLLRGLANLKVLPDRNILHQLYKPVKENLYYTNIKYLSWCADGFSRLNYFSPLPMLLNQILQLKDKITHLELNDFSSILNCIQAYILIKQYNGLGEKGNVPHWRRNPTSDNIPKVQSDHPNDGRNLIQHPRWNIPSDGSYKKLMLHEGNSDHREIPIQDSHSEQSRSQIIARENGEYEEQASHTREDHTEGRETIHPNKTLQNDVKNGGKKYHSIQRNQTDRINRPCGDYVAQEKCTKNRVKLNVELEKDATEYAPHASSNVMNKTDDTPGRGNYILPTSNDKAFREINSILQVNANTIPLEELYDIYLKLEKIILEKITESIYSTTPPYRVIMFELLTRLFRFYKKPIDLIIHMNTHRYDTSLLLKHTNSLPFIISNERGRKISNSQLSFLVEEYDFSNDFFFKDCPNDQSGAKKSTPDGEHTQIEGEKHRLRAPPSAEMKNDGKERQKNEQPHGNETNTYHHDVERNLHLSEDNQINVNTPLPKIFKTFLHSIYFRTPALGGRTIMLLLIALVRLNFGEREKFEYRTKTDSNILPFSKTSEIYRPFTKCIIREIIRKLESFNSEELIICAMCLNELDALNLDDELFSLLIERLFNLNKSNYMSHDQLLQLNNLFHFWYTRRRNLIAQNLRFSSAKQFKSFLA